MQCHISSSLNVPTPTYSLPKILPFIGSSTIRILFLCNTHKNLDPCIMEKEHYVTFAYNDHLSDTLTYLQLSLAKKNEYFEQFHSLIDEILLNFQCFFHEGSRSKIYIRHHSKSQPAFMYLMPKIRKSGHLNLVWSCSLGRYGT